MGCLRATRSSTGTCWGPKFASFFFYNIYLYLHIFNLPLLIFVCPGEVLEGSKGSPYTRPQRRCRQHQSRQRSWVSAKFFFPPNLCGFTFFSPYCQYRAAFVALAKASGVPARCFFLNVPRDLAGHLNYYRMVFCATLFFFFLKKK